MQKPLTNHAYIDGANLHNAMSDLGWRLDYQRLHILLKEKYGVKQAYLFIGLIPKYKGLYAYLQECGFILVFKEVTYDGTGKPKGNCDADLVLYAMRDAYEKKMERAVLVSSDGDYAELVKFLCDRGQFATILSPSKKEKCSLLLKRTNAPIAYIADKRTVLELK